MIRGVRMTAALAMAALSCACSSQPKELPRPPAAPTVLKLRHHVGGAHHRTLAHGDVWYQTYGSTLLVLPAGQTAAIQTIELGPPGRTGPASDMALAGDRVVVAVQDDAVEEFQIANPSLPELVYSTSAQDLGILPRTISVVDGRTYVSGKGGVVSLEDGKKIFTCDDEAGRVVKSPDGLLVCVGRQIKRVSNGRFVGSASDLLPLPSGCGGLPDGSFAFVRQGEQGATIGLMEPSLREVAAPGAVAAVKGVVHGLRFFDEALWVAADEQVIAYRIVDRALQERLRIDINGTRDVAMVAPNYLALGGESGRSIYRIADDDRGKGGLFSTIMRVPCELTQAASDGQHVVAAGELGIWLYLIGSQVELVTQPLERAPPPASVAAATVDASARLSDDGSQLVVSPANGPSWTYSEPNAKMHCVVASEGEFWVGHDRGITVLHAIEPPPVRSGSGKAVVIDPVIDRLRFEGPVLHLFPLIVGHGVSFVSRYGGVGVAEFVAAPHAGSSPQP